MAKVNTNISDLFFNTELEDGCKKFDAKGQFVEFNHPAMLEHAAVFLACLEGLGVECPTCEELLQDFYERV